MISQTGGQSVSFNLDYKLISKVLANRLRKVLGFVIHPDQTCSIPGRSIHDNCATVRDVIQYRVTTNTDGALISLDQTKAFDRVDWNYLFRVLATFRFGPSFCTWIKILYNDMSRMSMMTWSSMIYYALCKTSWNAILWRN